MNNDPQSLSTEEKIRLEAADWLVRCDRGLNAAEQDAYFEWLAADPRHGEWMVRQQQTWKQLDQMALWGPEHSGEPNPDLLAKPARRRWLTPAVLAMAASFAVLLALWRGLPGFTTEKITPVAETAAAGYQKRVLEDGSTVELNSGAAIDVRYTTGERRVRLVKGEALFTVAKNKTRPFIVSAGAIDVHAVGTAFNVRLGEEKIAVLVTEGTVRVEAVSGGAMMSTTGATALLIEAGNQTTINLAPAATPPVLSPVSPAQITEQLAWQPRWLDFNSRPLGEVVAEFNARNELQLIIADAELAVVPIVASFRSDNVEGFVRLLELSSGIRAERAGRVIRLHRAD